jgi:adenosine/AMP kinase
MIEFKIKKQLNLVYVRSSGTMTADDLIETMHQIVNNDDYQQGMSIIYDNRLLENELVTEDVAKVLSELNQFINESFPMKIALVVKRDVQFGMARMTEAMAVGLPVEIMVCKSTDDAKKCLGVPDSESISWNDESG